jgi:hypothetical protein
VTLTVSPESGRLRMRQKPASPTALRAFELRDEFLGMTRLELRIWTVAAAVVAGSEGFSISNSRLLLATDAHVSWQALTSPARGEERW